MPILWRKIAMCKQCRRAISWFYFYLPVSILGGLATLLAFTGARLQFGDYQVIFPKALSVALLATAMCAGQRVVHYSFHSE
jgi:hypothetical protein